MSEFVTFTIDIEVFTCHYTCRSCTTQNYGACLTCATNYFLQITLCQTYCPDGKFANDNTSTCDYCPLECTHCTGPSSTTDCQKCTTGYFKYNEGCVLPCPEYFYGDVPSGTC